MRFLRKGERGFDAYLSGLDRRVAEDRFRLEKGVRSILEDVRKRGDKAVLHYTRVFDGVTLKSDQLEVRRSEITRAYKNVPQDFVNFAYRFASQAGWNGKYVPDDLWLEAEKQFAWPEA